MENNTQTQEEPQVSNPTINPVSVQSSENTISEQPEAKIVGASMKDNQVAIFTTFYMVEPAYSLCNVVEDQLKMLTMHGYKIKVIVDEELKEETLKGVWKDPNVTLCRIPKVHRDNDGILPANYSEEVDKLYKVLDEILKDVKVVIAHDIVLQPAHIIHNIASRMVAEKRPDLRWIHWCHSATAPQVRCSDESAVQLIKSKFPNSIVAYPNDWDRKRVALNYGYEIDEVKCVHHPSDFMGLMFGEEIDLSKFSSMSDEDKEKLDKEINYPIRLTKDLVNEFDILNADVISAYPCRLDRGKQPEWNIKTMAEIKRLGRSVRLIIFDFHSTGGDKVTFREELKRIGLEWGLAPHELIFISEWREDTNLQVPREVVQNIKKISDFHMHPSTSETYSLVVQESMIWRNHCVLNHHFPPMRDIYGSKNVVYEPFGSALNSLLGEDGATTINIHHEKGDYVQRDGERVYEAGHFEKIASSIIYHIEMANPVINQWRFIRQTKSLKHIFRTQFEPLLYGLNVK